MKKVLLAVSLLTLMTACASNKPAASSSADKDIKPVAATTPPATAVGSDVAKVGEATTSDVSAKNATQTNATAVAAKVDMLNDANSILSKRSVHFPFDVDAIQDADKAIIKAHGEYLGANPDRKIRTEGNADERGSSEYNLALGQRRANNTKKALVLSGAQAKQIEAVSYGEEKPLATGHDEAAWSQNRRADINYR